MEKEIRAWTWAQATPRERRRIRSHYPACCRTVAELCQLFGLKEYAARCILAGADWRPEYIETGERQASGDRHRLRQPMPWGVEAARWHPARVLMCA
jgi:hypothetical protein